VLKLFALAVSIVASCVIEAIWSYLTINDLNNLEEPKSRFLKRVLSIEKKRKSRFTYQLVETDLLANDLKYKYNLPDTDEYDKVMVKEIVNFSQIYNNFLKTLAFSDPKRKNLNFKDRHLFTRYACHGFHFKLCKSRVYHIEACEKCKCKFFNQKMDTYHLFECKEVNCPSLSQMAKK
jgi:hypothetical protein